MLGYWTNGSVLHDENDHSSNGNRPCGTKCATPQQ